MNKKIWNLYAPIYNLAMKADQKIYNFMYRRIPRRIRNKEVLRFYLIFSDQALCLTILMMPSTAP